jgi:protein-disulfide isomerase
VKSRSIVLGTAMLGAVSLLLLLGACTLPQIGKGRGNPASAVNGSGALLERLSASGALEVGSATAPITILLVTHPSCRYCREFHELSLSRLREDFLRTGAVRLQIVILPIKKYPESDTARRALFCATEKGHGQAMLDSLFAADRIDQKAVARAVAEIGLDPAAFATCESSATMPLIREERWMQRLGVTLVPTFIVNGEKHIGLLDYPDLRGMIEEKL